MTENAKQTDQQRQISEVSPTRSPSRFVGALRLPRLHSARFHGGGLRDDRTWREGVLSLKHRRCNETNKYHPAQQSPHENDWLPGNENVHGRPPGTKSGSQSPVLYCGQTRHIRRNIVLVGAARTFSARNPSRCGMGLQSRRTGNCIHSTPDWRRPRKYDPGEMLARSTSTLRTTMWSSSLAVALARKSSVPLGLTSTRSYAPSLLPIGNSKFRVFALRGTSNGS